MEVGERGEKEVGRGEEGLRRGKVERGREKEEWRGGGKEQMEGGTRGGRKAGDVSRVPTCVAIWVQDVMATPAVMFVALVKEESPGRGRVWRSVGERQVQPLGQYRKLGSQDGGHKVKRSAAVVAAAAAAKSLDILICRT